MCLALVSMCCRIFVKGGFSKVAKSCASQVSGILTDLMSLAPMLISNVSSDLRKSRRGGDAAPVSDWIKVGVSISILVTLV